MRWSAPPAAPISMRAAMSRSGLSPSAGKCTSPTTSSSMRSCSGSCRLFGAASGVGGVAAGGPGWMSIRDAPKRCRCTPPHTPNANPCRKRTSTEKSRQYRSSIVTCRPSALCHAIRRAEKSPSRLPRGSTTDRPGTRRSSATAPCSERTAHASAPAAAASSKAAAIAITRPSLSGDRAGARASAGRSRSCRAGCGSPCVPPTKLIAQSRRSGAAASA